MSEERRGELAEGCAVDGPRIPPALPRELVRPVTRMSRRAPLRVQCDPCDQSVRERPPPEPPPRGAALDPRAKVFIPRAEREEREGKVSVRSFDDDNVSVSTDASCFSDLSLESVHTPSQDLLRWGNTTVYKNKRGGSIVHIYEYDPEDEVPVHDLQDLLQEQQLRQ